MVNMMMMYDHGVEKMMATILLLMVMDDDDDLARAAVW